MKKLNKNTTNSKVVEIPAKSTKVTNPNNNTSFVGQPKKEVVLTEDQLKTKKVFEAAKQIVKNDTILQNVNNILKDIIKSTAEQRSETYKMIKDWVSKNKKTVEFANLAGIPLKPVENAKKIIKKTAEKVNAVVAVAQKKIVGRSYAEEFAKEIKSKVGTLVLTDKYSSVEELYQAVEVEGKSLVFAFWWTKDDLQQFTYDPQGVSNAFIPKDGFENELDLASPIMVSKKGVRAILASVYTDCPYLITSKSLKFLDKRGLRITDTGGEYNIYELKEEVVEEVVEEVQEEVKPVKTAIKQAGKTSKPVEVAEEVKPEPKKKTIIKKKK